MPGSKSSAEIRDELRKEMGGYMRDTWLRLMVAALISITGFFATYTWGKLNRVKIAPGGPEPVARISSSSNDVQRRPAQRLIWQSVLKNQELYLGEAVRTASGAEAKIEFIGQGTVVQLDPDTVIEIEKGAGGINLDFLKGNIFIKSVGTGKENKITLMSGDQKIEVANSEVILSKTAPSARIQVQVVKGDVQVLDKNNRAQAIEPPKIKILSPKPNEAVYVRPDSEEKVAIEWQTIDSSYDVSVEAGEFRGDLKKIEMGEPISGSAGKTQVPLAIGKTYFKIVARSSRPGLPVLESPVLRADVRAKIPPQLLEPAKNAYIEPGAEKKPVVFSWGNTGRLSDLYLEVARSADLKAGLYSKHVGDQLTQSVTITGEPGLVYWRVSGRIPGAQQMISSEIQEFTFGKKAPDPLLAPIAKSPEEGAVIALLKSREEGVQLSWSAVKGANRYELTLLEETSEPGYEPKVYKREIESNELNVKKLQTAKYKWSVVAKDDLGQVSPESETRRFAIDGVPVLQWADGKSEDALIYKTAKPRVKIAWEKGPGQPVSWRVRVTGERQPASEQDWKTVSAPALDTQLASAGKYQVEAEAVDASGVVLARTSVRTMQIEQAPPLSAPDFAETMAEEINAKDNGTVEISWKPVADAKQYVLSVVTKDGKPVRSLKTASQKVELKGLKTGEYKVVLQTIDTLDREGPEGTPRTLRVPEYSDVRAPTLKKVNVK